MRILNAEYIRGLGPTSSVEREGGPEVGFIGRSNVGKSSMINALVMRKIARTSATPGATRLINLYQVQYEQEGKKRWMVFSDFPGFGYSKVSRKTYEGWEGMVDNYIVENQHLRQLIWVMDVRRDMDNLDWMVFEWLNHRGIGFDLVLTKVDKEGRNFAETRRRLRAQIVGEGRIFLFSAKDGYGRKELLSHIAHLVE